MHTTLKIVTGAVIDPVFWLKTRQATSVIRLDGNLWPKYPKRLVNKPDYSRDIDHLVLHLIQASLVRHIWTMIAPRIRVPCAMHTACVADCRVFSIMFCPQITL